MDQQHQEATSSEPPVHRQQRLRSPFSSASPPRASSPHQQLDLAAPQRPAALGHTRRIRSESAIVLGSRRATSGRARADTEAAAERRRPGGGGRASLIERGEEREEESSEQSRKRRTSDVEEEERESEQEAARVLATGLSPRSVRPTSAVRGSSDEEIKSTATGVDHSPEDEARSLLRRYTVASPSPMKKRARKEDGEAQGYKMASPLRYVCSEKAASEPLNSIGSVPPPIIDPIGPPRPLLFPPSPQPAPNFISARLGSTSSKQDQAPPSSSSASLAPPLDLQPASSSPPRPLHFDPVVPKRTSRRRLTPQAEPAPIATPPSPLSAPSTSTSTHSIPRPTHRPTLPAGHPHPRRSPPSTSLLPNIQTLLSSYHLLPTGSISLLEDLVEEGMKQLSGERRGVSDIAEAARIGRERQVEEGRREEEAKKERRRVLKNELAAKARVAKKGKEAGVKVEASGAAKLEVDAPMLEGGRIRFVEQTGLEKEAELERRKERRAVKERSGKVEMKKEDSQSEKGLGKGKAKKGGL